jgi:hypothetical protein
MYFDKQAFSNVCPFRLGLLLSSAESKLSPLRHVMNLRPQPQRVLEFSGIRDALI